MRVGVISDTHGMLRSEAEAQLAGVEHIIHAGDIGSREIVPRLGRIAPTTAIRGNVDTQDWARELPDRESITLADIRLYVIHDVGDIEVDPVTAGFGVVISGHSHRPRVERVDGVLYLNPGSAGPRRFRLPVTLAILELSAAEVHSEIHEIIA